MLPDEESERATARMAKTVLSLAKLSVIIENIDNLRHLPLLFWHPLCWG